MGLPCFRVFYLRIIELQPIGNRLPEHPSEFPIVSGINDRFAKFKILFGREDA